MIGSRYIIAVHTISHFLLDLLNPTGSGAHMAAAAPATLPVLPEPEEGRIWLNKDQAELTVGPGVKDYR